LSGWKYHKSTNNDLTYRLAIAQKKNADVEEVRREFEAAWKNADRPLELGDL